jgi:hypothetical protein
VAHVETVYEAQADEVVADADAATETEGESDTGSGD